MTETNSTRPNEHDFRRSVLTRMGARDAVVEELLAYNENVFVRDPMITAFPLQSEPHLERWKLYRREVESLGFLPALSRRLPQFRFPIRAGISEEKTYQDVIRRGVLPDEAGLEEGLTLREPESAELRIHPTFAGEIPVLILADRQDFESVLRALLYRCEPREIPPSMGATMVAGFNNWDRIHRYRQEWSAKNPGHPWELEFPNLIREKALYQDRFIILSEGPYSNVPANVLGLEESDWVRRSKEIRLEHESTHYFTGRVFSSMRNNMVDEILADYMGIVTAAGSYRADWFLAFVGLENFQAYRQGGRLENYRDGLSDAAFRVLGVLVKAAAENLEAFDREHAGRLRGPRSQMLFLMALTRLTLEEMASDQASNRLLAHWSELMKEWGDEPKGS